MIEEVLRDIYRIEIPFPNVPLGSTNSYLIKDPERNLIIDTGLNREECSQAMAAALGELEVDREKTDFFITHIHFDHIGLVSRLAGATSTIYFNQLEIDFIRENRNRIGQFTATAKLHGVPPHVLESDPHWSRAVETPLDPSLAYHAVKENCALNRAGYRFIFIETPGHSAGHMCLYEPRRKILFAGDHILGKITPIVQIPVDDRDTLRDYLASLHKIKRLDVDLVLPGHGNVFSDCRERINELEAHHEARLDEVLRILREGRANAFQAASRMTWNIDYDSWDLFPLMDKLLAVQEAGAHLRYLEGRGILRSEIGGGVIVYSLRS